MECPAIPSAGGLIGDCCLFTAFPLATAALTPMSCLIFGPSFSVGETRMDSRSSGRLATPVEVERTWSPDREAMKAALRVVLGLPRKPLSLGQERA